jgi:hypothetical protein
MTTNTSFLAIPPRPQTMADAAHAEDRRIPRTIALGALLAFHLAGCSVIGNPFGHTELTPASARVRMRSSDRRVGMRVSRRGAGHGRHSDCVGPTRSKRHQSAKERDCGKRWRYRSRDKHVKPRFAATRRSVSLCKYQPLRYDETFTRRENQPAGFAAAALTKQL